MSQEAKLVYIQMRMKELKTMKHIASVGIWIGVLLALFGAVSELLGLLQPAAPWLVVSGIIIACVQFYVFTLNSYQYFKLKDELKETTDVPQSP